MKMKMPETVENVKKPKDLNGVQKKKTHMKENKKKQKLTNGTEPLVNGDEQAKPVKNNKNNKNKNKTHEKPTKPEDASIFEYFKELTTEDEQTRRLAAIRLIVALSKTTDEDKRQKELSYALKRLIRGCGASTNSSRVGFYTALVAFLRAFSGKVITIEQVFETAKKELHVGATIGNKEDADAVVGKILTCRAVIQSGRVATLKPEELQQIVSTLLQATKHRTYHASLAFSALIELNQLITEDEFITCVWPQLQSELVRPWPKQTLQTVHCLIATQKQYPTVLSGKFMKAHYGGTQLLNEASFQTLHKIFWDNSNTDILTHPAFELFGGYIATCPQLGEFWREYVEPKLKTPTKLLEIETLKIATDMLNNLNGKKVNVGDFLGDNFMKLLVNGLKAQKQKKDEMLKAFYTEFFDALVAYSTKLTDDAEKVAIIRRLILPPGIFDIENYTGKRIVHEMLNSLGAKGIEEIFALYKKIFLNACDKNPENSADKWLNFERRNAGYMLQHLLGHKAVVDSYKWREEQLQFLLTSGVFYVTDAAVLCKKEEAGEFSKDFGEQCKNIFYTSLQSKLQDLQQEKQLLYNLVEYCNRQVQQHHKALGKYFKLKQFDENLEKSWQLMYDSVHSGNTANTNNSKDKKKKAKSDDKLDLVFHILILNMGLQLFKEPEMAGPAIDDLLKCMERTKDDQKAKKKAKAKQAKADGQEEEPEWIEVVVDLFLHLLSQNANALRTIVNALFGHLCENLNLNATHQILTMLDMKDGHNPLSAKGEESDDDDEDDEGDEEEVDEKVGSDEEDDEDDDNDDEESEDDDDEDEEEDPMDAGDEEVTESDKLRNAISQALMANGGAVDADDDMASVDLNDMTEEEGRRLDEALANAFKALRKGGPGGGSSQQKKSKSYRVKTTTVMHFRLRVLDLLEIYLHRQPTLLITIEIMVALFNMLEFCVAKELRPLQTKVESVLAKLTSHKAFTIDADLRVDNLLDYLRLIVEKSVPAAVYEVANKMRNKCVTFIIGNCNKLADGEKSPKLIEFLSEYVTDFVVSRNPKANITLFTAIFKLSWLGVWDLALKLAQDGVTVDSRTYRRIQIYQLLTVLYQNTRLHNVDAEKSSKKFAKIEKIVGAYIKAMAGDNSNSKRSAKEFETLLELLITVKKSSRHATTVLCTPDTCELIQKIRLDVQLESNHVYQQYCAVHKRAVVGKNSKKSKGVEEIKKVAASAVSEDEADATKQTNGAAASRAGEKRKASKELRKLKKQKKLLRLEAVSKGLNGGIAFAQGQSSSTVVANGEVDEDDDDDDSDAT